MVAIKAGTFSVTLKQTLEQAETERNRLKQTLDAPHKPNGTIPSVLPDLTQWFKRPLGNIAKLRPHEVPGQEQPMDAMQKQQLKTFDTSARTWLIHAGFAREHGNALVNAIGRVIEATNGMNESQLEAYGQAEFAKLERAYGSDLDAKLQLAAKMIHELDAKQPGLKQFLKTRGIGDSALVASQLIQQAERWAIRNGH